jgi:hypothetical protein
MTNEEVDDMKWHLDKLFSEAKNDRRDAEFYLRLLVQAVLTYGENGVLKIDIGKGQEARRLAETARIEFGMGEIRVEENVK